MLANIRIVLVRPRGSGNIGSIARAMKNMGQTELAIVGKARTRSFWARAMAVHGRDILGNAKCYDTHTASDYRLCPCRWNNLQIRALSQAQSNTA